MDRDTLVACLADLGACGVQFCGNFTDSDGGGWDVSDVETAIAELRADVAKLEKLLAWAKTMPNWSE